jgi:hypothetical protein
VGKGRKEGAEELRNFLCTFLVGHVTRLILISNRSSLGLVAIYLEDGAVLRMGAVLRLCALGAASAAAVQKREGCRTPTSKGYKAR